MGGSGLSSLGSWTLLQLRDLAKRIGLGGYSRMDKSVLLDAVSQALPEAKALVSADVLVTPPGTTPDVAAAVVMELSSHIAFLPRDPQWAFVFWEISASDQERAAAAGGTQQLLKDAERELGSALSGLAERDAIDIAGAWIVWMEGLAHDAS